MEKRKILLTGNMSEMDSLRLHKKLESADRTLAEQVAMVKEKMQERNLTLKKDDDGYSSLDQLIEDYIRQSDHLFDRYATRPNKAVDILITAMTDGGFIEKLEEDSDLMEEAV